MPLCTMNTCIYGKIYIEKYIILVIEQVHVHIFVYFFAAAYANLYYLVKSSNNIMYKV